MLQEDGFLFLSLISDSTEKLVPIGSIQGMTPEELLVYPIEELHHIVLMVKYSSKGGSQLYQQAGDNIVIIWLLLHKR